MTLIMMIGDQLSAKGKERRGKCVPPLVLQVICSAATLRWLATSSSAPCSHLRKGNSVTSACSLVTEGMCQWWDREQKHPKPWRTKSSIKMFVRLSQANKRNNLLVHIRKKEHLDVERQMHRPGLTLGHSREFTLSSTSGSSRENPICIGTSSQGASSPSRAGAVLC